MMLYDLRAYLAADSTISGIVGQRIFPVTLVQNPTYPALTYSQISRVSDYTLCGPSGLSRPRASISAWALTDDAARVLAQAVLTRIDGFRGIWPDGDSPPGGTRVGSVRLDNETDLYEDDVKVYRVVQDYIVSFTDE